MCVYVYVHVLNGLDTNFLIFFFQLIVFIENFFLITFSIKCKFNIYPV